MQIEVRLTGQSIKDLSLVFFDSKHECYKQHIIAHCRY